MSSTELRRPLLVRVDCLKGCADGEGDRLRVDRDVDFVSFAVDFRVEVLAGGGAGLAAAGFREGVLEDPFGVVVVA